MKVSKRDLAALTAVTVAGLAIWFAYVAVQPHDYSQADGSPDYYRTWFGWDAPGIDRHSHDLPDRSWIILVGWPLLGLVAGWLRPRRSMSVGLLAVLPAWTICIPTSPRDMDGLWGLNVMLLPACALCIGALAIGAGNARTWVDGRPPTPPTQRTAAPRAKPTAASRAPSVDVSRDPGAPVGRRGERYGASDLDERGPP